MEVFWLDRINKMKKEKGMTTDDISNLSGIPKGTLNKLFAGQTKDPQLSTVKAVVHCMGFTLDDLDENLNYHVKVKNGTEEFRADEKELLGNYNKLNDDGQEDARDHIEFLLSKQKYLRPEYIKSDNSKELA